MKERPGHIGLAAKLKCTLNRIQAPLKRAKACLKDHRCSEPLVVIRVELQQTPDTGRLWGLRAMCKKPSGNLDAAFYVFEQTTMLVPFSPAVQCALARC